MGEDREKNSYVYEFDELNRMEKIYRGDGKWAEYRYDGTSARVGKTIGTAASEETETTKYYNMGATVLNEVSSEEGNTTNLIGAGIEARLSVESSYFLQKNAHGDVTAAVSGTERVATYDYDAFGNTLVEEGEINNPIRYSGEYLDKETGVIYLRARYYDPSVGRFISEDNHWNPSNMIYGDNADNPVPNMSAIMQSSNLFVYCTNNPVMYKDPSGNVSDEDYKYGTDSKVYMALVILGEAWWAFPDYRHAIEELANEIRWVADTRGSKNLENKISLGLRSGAMKGLSTVEQVLAAAYAGEALSMNQARNAADKETKRLYGQEGNGTDVANAFKHIYWSARATSMIGEKMTRLFTNAHEFGWYAENLNDPEAMKMDLHNNQLGRQLGTQYPSNRLVEASANAIANGRAAVIKNGRSVLTTPQWRAR